MLRTRSREDGVTIWTTALLVASIQVVPAWEEAPVPDSLAHVEVRAIETTAAGDVWISVRGQGLARLQEDQVTWVTEDDGLASSGIADLHEDRMGRIWAVGVGGFSILEGDMWEAQRAFGSLQPRVIFSVYEEKSADAIWLAANGGAGRLEDGVWTVFRESDGLPNQVVHGVVVDADGTAWLACRTGLARLENGEVDVQFRDVNFRTALEGPDGILWFGTSNGIYEWDGSSWTQHLAGKTVYTRSVTDDGSVWAGSATAGVFRNAGNGWEAVALPDRLQGSEVFDIVQGPDGSIWLATSAGLGRLVPAQ